MNHYERLGVELTATTDEIRAAYRNLTKACHPDSCPGDATAEERFKQLGEAHSVLTDPDKRYFYNLSITPRPQRAGDSLFGYSGSVTIVGGFTVSWD